MKSYAIITDIHGNSAALQAVLKDINQRDVDHIFCLGDMVGIGPDSNEVMTLLLENQNISFVVGNHELAVIAAYKNEDPPQGHQNERAHHKWLADRINKKYIELFINLPKMILLEEAGCKIYFAHYHLDKDKNYLPIETNPTIENLDEIYSGSDYDMVCFGHHHVIHHYKSDKRIYFNPGSLGCYNKPVARYGIIEVKDLIIKEKLVEVPYYRDEFLKSYEMLKVPDREFILKIFHGA